MSYRTVLGVPAAIASLLIALGCVGNNGNSGSNRATAAVLGVMTGQIEPITESVGIFIWGDSNNQLCHQWSLASNDRSGWFYGTSYSWSSADVYVLAAPSDPLAVVSAENFDFTTGSVEAREGDTVFFRGRNGFFGAWSITDVEGSSMDAVLSGSWYFKAGGGGDFTSAVVAGGASNYDANVGGCEGY
jgi:hypothetical protein